MNRATHLFVVTCGLMLIMLLFARHEFAQCVNHPEGRTGVILDNETSYDLTFFIDDIEKGPVVAGAKSTEWAIIAGEHLFGARALIQGQGYWVMIVNDVPEGQLCTWTLLDPPQKTAPPEFTVRSRSQ